MNVYPRPRTNSESSTDYSDESCGSSCSCDQHSDSSCDSVAAWENDIQPNGELFYIKYSKRIKREPLSHTKRDVDVPFKSSNEKKGKIARLIHRKRNAKRENDIKKDKVTFLDSQKGETKEIIFKLENDTLNRTMGRRYKLSEYLLGVSTSIFENTDRVMISGFVSNADTERKNIKIGDWLKEINGILITSTNLDTVLNSIKLPADVKLTLQRTSVINEESSIDNSIILDKRDWFNVTNELSASSLVGILFLNTDDMNNERNDISYCYPLPCDEANIYYRIKGTFLTLNHLLPNIVSASPQSSTLIIKDEMVHVTYVIEESGLLIFAMPANRCNLLCLNRLTTKLVRYLKFLYRTLTSCFAETLNHVYLNNLFGRILQSDLKTFNDFQYLFTYPRWFSLPNDIQMKIDDLLHEFEANDFGDLSEDHFGYQRHYTIISCCLYEKGVLIASHMNVSDQMEVNIFCDMHGLLQQNDVQETVDIHSLVVWKEVYPSSLHDMSNNAIFVDRRWFLLIVGLGQNVLTTLLESGGCSTKAVGNPGPDHLYVEELQELLHNIQTLGINQVTERLMRVKMNTEEVNRKTSCSKPSSWKSAESLTNFMLNTSGVNNRKKMSILKNKEAVDTTSVYHSSPLLPVADGGDMSDSLSRTTSSVLSDECTPVIGRRTERQRQAIRKLQSSSYQCLSDSENSIACSLSDTINKTFVKDLKAPSRVTRIKENVLLYYLDIDKHKGVMIYPNLDVNDNNNYQEIISNFKNVAQHISELFQNKMDKNCDSKSSSVKEFGVLFESEKTNEGISTYWVVGRLFNWPYSREIYVCYEDSVPQNMVEIAFNFALSN